MLIFQQAHKSHQNYHLITDMLLYIHETIGYVHQTRWRYGKMHSATCFARTYHICHSVRPLGHHVKNWSFSSSSM